MKNRSYIQVSGKQHEKETAVQPDLRAKRRRARALTLGAAAAAGAVGAIPLGINDGFILAPLETTLVTSISKVYDLQKSDDLTKNIIARIIECGAVGIAAKALINRLKLIPGVANLAADALNAIVAASVVMGIGTASGIIMEKVYLGQIDRENLDWVNRIMEGQLGKAVRTVTRAAAEKNGRIDAGDVLKIFSKKDEDMGSDEKQP